MSDPFIVIFSKGGLALEIGKGRFMLAQIILLLILLFLSGFFSSSETAFFSISRARAHHMAKEGGRVNLLILKMKEKPHRLLSTVLIGNNLVNIAASAMATAMAIDFFQNRAVGIVTGIMTLVILVFGEILPKTIATRNNVAVARLVVFPIYWCSILFRPLIWLLDFIPLLAGRVKPVPSITEEELISIVEVGNEEGEIREEERELIQNIFEFDDISAYEIMIPRPDMFVVDLEGTISLEAVLESGFSRIPVVQGSMDMVVGVLHVGDLFRFHVANGRFPDPKEVMRKPYFIPESKKINTLLTQFKVSKQHMAIVVDEYGGVAGLVTLEDVLEELVGDISDESDKDEEEYIRVVGPEEWIMLGKVSVEEANEVLPSPLEDSPDYDTISGFLLHQIGRIPKEGHFFDVPPYGITVLAMDGNRILKLKFHYKAPV